MLSETRIMTSDLSLHNHAIERLKERFGVDESWLKNELEEGKFVWLKGSGGSGDVKDVRYGHLIYLPHRNDYCIVVIDYRSKLAITVLTEKMALNSAWGEGLDQAAKLRAKRIALGEEAVDDVNFLQLYARERGQLSVTVQARTVSHEWKPIVLRICKVNLWPEQIDIDKKRCTLSEEQMKDVSMSIANKIATNEMRPYCEISVRTSRGKAALISNRLDSVSDIECAENARRWES
jgi:hypothetical protein